MKDNLLILLGGIGLFELIVMLFFIIVLTLLWLWAVVDLIKSDFNDSINKLIWALIVILVPFIGAFWYLIAGHKQKVKFGLD